MKRVGYWVSEKKSRKLNFAEFERMCRDVQIELTKIDLIRPLEEQGPFDLILHKLTDVVAKADLGHGAAQIQIERLQNYCKAHPNMVVIDPLDNVRQILDRYEQYKLVEQSQMLEDDSQVFTPNFVELTTRNIETNKQLLEQAGVKFPFVCKPTVAHGSSFAHQMAIIFSEKGLHDVNPPCVAQNFVNHNAILYKIFVVGGKHSVVERPSLKNFRPSDRKTIFFDSHDVSKADSASFLNELDDLDLENALVTPNDYRFTKLVNNIQAKLGLDLFGIDVIIENQTHRYAVIDINAFPGYDGVDDFFQMLLDYIIQRLDQRPKVQILEPFLTNQTCTNANNPVRHYSKVLQDATTKATTEREISEKRTRLKPSNGLCYPRTYVMEQSDELSLCHSIQPTGGATRYGSHTLLMEQQDKDFSQGQK